jgi:hypothetical protein
MGERAECVMLNKGPHVVEAVRALDDILRRMQSHLSKKSSMLRELHLAHGLPLAELGRTAFTTRAPPPSPTPGEHPSSL